MRLCDLFNRLFYFLPLSCRSLSVFRERKDSQTSLSHPHLRPFIPRRTASHHAGNKFNLTLKMTPERLDLTGFHSIRLDIKIASQAHRTEPQSPTNAPLNYAILNL